MAINKEKSYENLNKAVERAKKLIEDGADSVLISGIATSGFTPEDYFQFNVTGQFTGE
jgi:2-methylisocitrate lyase-like PEP mutase family enzyme